MKSHPGDLQGGIYEIVIGVEDLAAATAHWQAFGYAPAAAGHLNADAAASLYGRASSLRSIRLAHGAATSGLIRLQCWEDPLPGELGVRDLRVGGSRWSVHRTSDITPALVWGRHLMRVEPGIRVRGPVIHSVSATAASINHAVLTPLFRHVLMVRHGIDVPLYGTPDHAALLGASEVVHAGIVVPVALAQELDFYRLLGFKPASVRRVVYDPDSVATQMFPLSPGEALVEHDFDDPRSASGAGQLPGRLRAFVLESESTDSRQTEPGQLGYNLYSIRHRRCNHPGGETGRWLQDLGAKVLGAGPDEFATPTCRFRAPDGYQWLVMP